MGTEQVYFFRTISLHAQFQLSGLQIGQDSSVYILEITLGRVYDVISHLVCIFYNDARLKLRRKLNGATTR